MKYTEYRYIYPPRPKNCINPEDINFWEDNGGLITQCKLNGSNCVIFTNGEKVITMNRHGSRLTNFNINLDEILSLHRGEGWMILNGEYLNKSKKDENNQLFNHKFVIFDILCLSNNHLVGRTFSGRIDILDGLYGKSDSEKDYLFSISENVYRVKSYTFGFKRLFDEFSKIDMLEGLVMKRSGAKLEAGNSENNNSKSQIKVRKSTKGYKY